MDARKVKVLSGAALAGAGVLALRALGPKLHQLHERCLSACVGQGGQASAKEQSGCAAKCGHAPGTGKTTLANVSALAGAPLVTNAGEVKT